MYKQQEQVAYNDDIQCTTPEEKPELAYLVDKIGYEINEIIDLKNQLKRKLHQIKDTNVPDASCDQKEEPIYDLVTVLSKHSFSLGSLKEEFYQLNKKLNSLI